MRCDKVLDSMPALIGIFEKMNAGIFMLATSGHTIT